MTGKDNIEKVMAELKFLGIKPDIENEYSARFLVQKIVFLAQTMTKATDYNFTIHLRGPFSKDLQWEYYQHAAELQNLKTVTKLSQKEEDALSEIKRICLSKISCPNDIPSGSKEFNILEATGTAAYFLRVKPQPAAEELFSIVKSLKPHLKPTEILIGINNARELLFDPTQVSDSVWKDIKDWEELEN
jgi:hypothetical protein